MLEVNRQNTLGCSFEPQISEENPQPYYQRRKNSLEWRAKPMAALSVQIANSLENEWGNMQLCFGATHTMGASDTSS